MSQFDELLTPMIDSYREFTQDSSNEAALMRYLSAKLALDKYVHELERFNVFQQNTITELQKQLWELRK